MITLCIPYFELPTYTLDTPMVVCLYLHPFVDTFRIIVATLDFFTFMSPYVGQIKILNFHSFLAFMYLLIWIGFT